MSEEIHELKVSAEFTQIGKDEQVEQGLEVAYLLPEDNPIRLKLIEALALKCIYGAQKIGFFTRETEE